MTDQPDRPTDPLAAVLAQIMAALGCQVAHVYERGRLYDMPTWRRAHPRPSRYGLAYRSRQIARRRRRRTRR